MKARRDRGETEHSAASSLMTDDDVAPNDVSPNDVAPISSMAVNTSRRAGSGLGRLLLFIKFIELSEVS